eukprot:m.458426 g.458426  ORF g.458426 m.458426 type:complete len:541 (+) comp21497_c0_seq1:102-1724(+)
MEGSGQAPSFSDIHNDLLAQLTPPIGQVTTHEERGGLQTVPEDAHSAVNSGNVARPAAPPRAYLYQTIPKRSEPDMRRYPQIHLEDGYGYSEDGKVDELMLEALRREREALRKQPQEGSAAVPDDRTPVQKARDWVLGVAGWLGSSMVRMTGTGGLPRERCPVHAFARHPTLGKFALAFERGLELHTVGKQKCHQIIYKKQTGVWRMNDVRALAWCPGAVNRLAVGCREGVMLWDVGPKAGIGKEGPDARRLVWSDPTVATLREFPGQPSQTIAWHPSGYLLASGCTSSATVHVWDTSRGVNSPMIALAAGGATQLLKWSPSGARLLQTTTSGIIRIWETRTWTYEQFRASSVCRTACWSFSGEVLLLAVDGESLIYSVQVLTGDAPDPTGGYEMHPIFDTRGSTIESMGDTHEVGGLIRDLAWDDTNTRLAVSFKPEPGSAQVSPIAIFNTHMRYSSAHPDLSFGGFIRGPQGATPVILDFEAGHSANNPSRSLTAVLVIGWQWEEGNVEGAADMKTFQQCTFQFLPFYFGSDTHLLRR